MEIKNFDKVVVSPCKDLRESLILLVCEVVGAHPTNPGVRLRVPGQGGYIMASSSRLVKVGL